MAKEMLFSVVCPTCEAKIGVHDKRLINQLVQCPKCGSIVQLTPPKGYAKSEDSIQKPEEKDAPPSAEKISQPVSEKKDTNEKTPQKNTPSPVPKTSAIPVPPPASIPVPPPISIPEPIAPESLMPEPMSPGGFNSNSTNGGKSISQRVGSLSNHLPLLMPYLVISIGVMVLITMLVLFFWGGSKKEINNNDLPVVENKESKEDKGNKEITETELTKDTEDKKEDKESIDTGSNADNKDKESEKNKSNLSTKEDVVNNEDLTPKIEKTEETGLSDDKSDKDEDAVINNESGEIDENIEKSIDDAAEFQPEAAAKDDNPFQEVDLKSDDEPEQDAPSVDNPEENDDAALTSGDDVTLENIDNNESNQDENLAEDGKSDSKKSSIPGLNVNIKSISIRESKFSQCLQTIRELGALPVEINWDSLRRNGVNADDKISWSGKDVTVQTALSEVLAQRGLMFKVNSEGKIVFVPRASVNARSDSSVNVGEQGGSAMVKTQYSVADLVGQSPEKTAALIKSIREFLCPGDWKEFGGTGTIVASGGGSVMITQSQQNQWIIADFLDRLRLARRLAPLYNRDASLEPMSVRAQSALKRNVGINFQPTADLKTALSEIGQRISVNILLDEPSLKIAGISAQFPISFDAREMSLEETFNRIQEETGLTYLAQTPISFIVTTAQGAKSMMAVEFFPISDLVSIGLTPAVLMEQIVKFEPKSWKSQDAASFGLIDYDANSDCLIVRQSPSVLSKINDLLTQLRARLKEKE